MGFILLFDITNEQSFLNIRDWISQLKVSTSITQSLLFFSCFPQLLVNSYKIIAQLRSVLKVTKLVAYYSRTI
ncbi:unnamed protein product [Enterobius vermicularis]|uniref:Ras family protein n=1 Tax=Enterobius vermicularis TaxID=51028 RepID=A0A0N4VK98_ENTVE|nr:unnamed protein product [Enterobius vermicularis]